ncbi:hypothetical protein [Streptomyces sp. CdTB01]|uniref:hypothetical protein n=1 Tax=Streptomyces sp. CdTB01 TaxID=1725411 RepID=UPI00073A6069|nr:hypothetical protein [Streptomyces sp. CdTB01]ALV36031.1 hypothetical protein AS200_31300 [Streptomyces sp. CdTB01]
MTKSPGSLARELVETESQLGRERRRREQGSRAERFWRGLRAAWRRLRGRGEGRADQAWEGAPSSGAEQQRTGAPPEPGAAAGGPVTAGPGAAATRLEPSAAEQKAIDRMASLIERIQRLPPDELKAFEDAVLKLVRTDETLKKAFSADPMSMPAVARFAVNAHLREAEAANEAASTADTRSRRPASPSPETPGPAFTPLTVDLPGPRLPDGQALWDTAERAFAEGTSAVEALDRVRDRTIAEDARQQAALRERLQGVEASPDAVRRRVSADETHDGHAFLAVEAEHRAGQERAEAERSRTASAAGSTAPTPPSPLMSPVSPLSPVNPFSPLSALSPEGAALSRSSSVTSTLGPEGLAVLREQPALTRGPSVRSDPHSPSAPGGRTPARPAGQDRPGPANRR